MSRPTQIIIDLNSLRHNLKEVKRLAPTASILAMVKSNGYGHGIERVALGLPNADAFGVASFEEGMQLRSVGIQQPIVLMEGLFNGIEIDEAHRQDFTLVVHHESQVQMLEKVKFEKPFTVWLKIDTGMRRLGFHPTEARSMYDRLKQCQSVKKPIGFMTHFAEADSNDRIQTMRQMALFDETIQGLSGPRSLANSAGIVAWPSAHADWVRPGILLYGASPFEKRLGSDYALRPVMTFQSKLIALHNTAAGDRVGYGGTWTCPEAMPVGVVGVGYGDGYPRHVKHGAPVLVNGKPCPLIGRVAMDMLAVDLRTQPEAKVGDTVTLWGPDLPVEVIAEYSETSAYELLTRITQRVKVIVKDSVD